MAATADPRAKPPPAPTTHHLEPWARQPRPHRVVRAAAHPTLEDPPSQGARDRRRASSDDDGGIDGLRAKLMGHLRDAADRLRLPQPGPPPPPPPPPPPKEPDDTAPPPPAEQEQQQEADKPWKLRERTRRRPAALASWPAAPSRRRKRARFSVALAPEDIEEDIYALTGGRPRRRPRKRPRAVQRQLDSVFPGLWLTEITADDYKVPDQDE